MNHNKKGLTVKRDTANAALLNCQTDAKATKFAPSTLLGRRLAKTCVSLGRSPNTRGVDIETVSTVRLMLEPVAWL